MIAPLLEEKIEAFSEAQALEKRLKQKNIRI
jgi:hypothetical protein